MLSSRKRADEDSVPLLDQDESSLHDDRTLFSVGDDDDDDTPLAQSHLINHPSRATSRSDELTPYEYMIPPTLRSTVQSREAEFDLDTDEIEDPRMVVPDPVRNQDMPLLMGLVQSSARLSTEIPLHTFNGQANQCEEAENTQIKIGKTGGMLESIANMANAILGAGIIGLPYAIKEAGFFSGILLLVFLCLLTDWTIRLIIVNAKLSGRNSYISIMDHCFGPSGRAAVSFFQFAFAFGGDTIPHVIRALFPKLISTPVLFVFANRNFIIALCTITVSYPLSLHRDISKLARASGLALVGMLIIVVSVVTEGEYVTSDLKGDPSKRFTFFGSEIFQAIGVISFAFVCHHNSLLIYGSLQTPTLDRFSAVTHISTFVSLLFCMLLGLSGYLVFTDKTRGNILNNFSPDDTLINVARFCFGLNMFTTLPLELFVCREVIEQYFFEHEEFDRHRHIILTTVILFSAMILSMMTCDLGVMLEITGGISATAFAFIFPAICYLKLTRESPWGTTKICAVACTFFGLSVLVLSVILGIRKAALHDTTLKVCS
ncbi:transmembrane amino acid transporter protein-domain-containing protein [Cantharellus anzutake]|uniref:transmembrane amino acid transporter protein-domain-containing protein n=1 Tax=Cantharellus anzutake TaxID=1750568 RepID=UPI001904F41B|nr:transmembrane amino acid transporter protein-domain-containing protein [Cantharellus anzutake]KAF8332651.1 transmembrane amino acid transporter protein-domain-containing protein [Cantharellus anzutake]